MISCVEMLLVDSNLFVLMFHRFGSSAFFLGTLHLFRLGLIAFVLGYVHSFRYRNN